MREPTVGDRAVPIVMAFHTLVATLVYASAHGRGTDTFVSPALLIAFGLATVTLLAFGLTFRLSTLAWSGAVTTSAFMLRAGDLLIGILQSSSQVPDIRAVLGVTTWTMLAGGTAFLWLRIFHPLVSWRRSNR